MKPGEERLCGKCESRLMIADQMPDHCVWCILGETEARVIVFDLLLAEPAPNDEELVTFRELKGYLPRVITVHMNPSLEKEIMAEAVGVSKDLNTSITLAEENMRISI